MLVLHVNWAGDGLRLWAESLSDYHATTTFAAHTHPFAVDAAVLPRTLPDAALLDEAPPGPVPPTRPTLPCIPATPPPTAPPSLPPPPLPSPPLPALCAVAPVLGENVAFSFRSDTENRKLSNGSLAVDAERVANRRRLEKLRAEILAAVPGAAVASDQRYREADLAIDFREDVAPLPQGDIDRIVALFEAAGATAKVSSIHVNGWFGDYDKLTTTRIMLDEAFGIDFEAEKDHFVFAGDSPNDAPMFAAFPNAVGVANVRDFEGRLPAAPAFVTEARSGAGFAELAEALLAAILASR